MFPVYSNATTQTSSGTTEPSSIQIATTTSSQKDEYANYIMQGLSGQTGTQGAQSKVSALPDLTGRPLPTGIPSNASWSTMVLKPNTYRPDRSISWSSSMPSVQKCWSDIVTWRRSSVDWWRDNYVGRTVSGPVVSSTWLQYWNSTMKVTSYPSSVSAYTLCDGSPRVDVSPVTKTTVSTLSTYTESSTRIANWSSVWPEWDEPQPCDATPDMCRLWYYHSNIQEVAEDELLQQCGRPTNSNESCVIKGGPIELIYWPVLPRADLCDNNATRVLGPTAFASNTSAVGEAPATITTLGHTFTSGNVYLSFSTLFASWDGFWNHVGPNFTDLIVPLPSSSLFSQCGGARSARNHGTPLNYEDLNWPVPASAYSCQARCDPVGEPICPGCEYTEVPTTGECGTIWSDINPNLAMPTEIRDLVPEWSTCLMYNDRIPNFWFDPPIALTKQSAIAVPTLHVEPTTEPAAPSSTLPSAVPAETGADTVYFESTSTSATSRDSIPETSVAAGATSTSHASANTEGQVDQDPNEASKTPEETTSSQHSTSDKGAGTSPTSVLSASPPTAVTEHGSPVLTYDPIASSGDPNTAIDHSTAINDPTTSGSLNALSVLQSALSQLSTAQPTVNTPEPIVIDISSSKVVFVPLPTTTTDAQSQEVSNPIEQNPGQTASSAAAGVSFSASGSDALLSNGTNGVAIIDPSRTTYISLPEATINSILSATAQTRDTTSTPTSPQESKSPTNTALPENNNDPPNSFVYSPSSEPTTTRSTTHLILAFGSLTLTASAIPHHPSSSAAAVLISGTTLTLNGPALTLSHGGEIVSFAPGGSSLVVLQPSGGGTQALSTVSGTASSSAGDEGSASASATGTGTGTGSATTTSDLPVVVEQPSSETGSGSAQKGSSSSSTASSVTSSELPVVVEQPGSGESSTDGSSSAASTAASTSTGTGSGEEEVDSSNGAGIPTRQGLSAVVFAMFVIAVLLV